MAKVSRLSKVIQLPARLQQRTGIRNLFMRSTTGPNWGRFLGVNPRQPLRHSPLLRRAGYRTAHAGHRIALRSLPSGRSARHSRLGPTASAPLFAPQRFRQGGKLAIALRAFHANFLLSLFRKTPRSSLSASATGVHPLFALGLFLCPSLPACDRSSLFSCRFRNFHPHRYLGYRWTGRDVVSVIKPLRPGIPSLLTWASRDF
jgi:hypothetical protein